MGTKSTIKHFFQKKAYLDGGFSAIDTWRKAIEKEMPSTRGEIQERIGGAYNKAKDFLFPGEYPWYRQPLHDSLPYLTPTSIGLSAAVMGGLEYMKQRREEKERQKAKRRQLIWR